MPTWDDRFPFLSSVMKRQIVDRFSACGEPIAKALGITVDDIKASKSFGCGNYGCALLVPALAAAGKPSVIKITTDNLEAFTVHLLTGWGESKPDGIVHYEAIWQLGKCSVLPRMRPFEYTTQEQWKEFRNGADYHARKPRKSVYRGPGAPFRPVWVIQREELPDVPVKDLGGKRALQTRLDKLMEYMWSRAEDYGLRQARSYSIRSPITYDQMVEIMKPVQGLELMDALDWLLERDIAFFDFKKIANLGWREKTGLVIRDIGFASTTMESPDDPQVLGSLRGLVRVP